MPSTGRSQGPHRCLGFVPSISLLIARVFYDTKVYVSIGGLKRSRREFEYPAFIVQSKSHGTSVLNCIQLMNEIQFISKILFV